MKQENRMTLPKGHDSNTGHNKDSTDKPELIRQHHTFNFVNACVMKVEVRLFLRIPAKWSFFPYAFKERQYLPELRAKLQDGTELPILRYERLGYTLEEIQQAYSDIVSGVTKEQAKTYTNFAFIGLPEQKSEYYEELTISWEESLEEVGEIGGKMTKYTHLFRGFPPTADSSLYVAFKIDDKYELVDDPFVYKIEHIHYGWDNNEVAHQNIELVEGKDYSSILKDKRNFVIRFERKISYDIQIDYFVSVPKMVNNWLWLGFALGIGSILYSLFVFFKSTSSSQSDSFQQFLSPLIAGIIAALIGFRIVLFHDIELLTNWNWIYIILVVVNLAVLILLGLHQYDILPLK